MGDPGAPVTGQRRLAVDVLRGASMLLLIGGADLVRSLPPSLQRSALGRQFVHPAWNGLTILDLAFPLFLFLVGVSAVLAHQAAAEATPPAPPRLRSLLVRALVLLLLGIVYNGGLSVTPLAELRLPGVLQRIALCYLGVALVYRWWSDRGLLWLAGLGLLGYGLLLLLVPAPGQPAGALVAGQDVTAFVDRALLPGRLYQRTWDPEGLLSTIPALATTALGGYLATLLYGRGAERPALARLAAVGLALGVLGLGLSPALPLNKHLWTPSFALVVSGTFVLALVGLEAWIGSWTTPRGWLPFVVIGRNALLFYLLHRFVSPLRLGNLLAGGSVAHALGAWGQLPAMIAGHGVLWLFLYWLYRRRAFLVV